MSTTSRPPRVVRAGQALPATFPPPADLIVEGDNLDVLGALPDEAFTLVYIDPPFNTGKRQVLRSVAVERDENGVRGFHGRRYASRLLSALAYDDAFADYLAFLEPRLREARRLLADDGTLYVHVDYREAHYCKLLLDEVFGRAQFVNEIIWAYDYGGRSTRRWPAKHDTILMYAKNAGRYHFDAAEVDREPYMAPGLVTPEKRARGKLPTDVWWHTIVPTNARERTGYPTQKPEGILRRMIAASTRPGDWCLDFFAGSGTTAAAAAGLGRRYVVVDSNPDAVAVMARRLAAAGESDRPSARDEWPRPASVP